jgi:hypothetical protein
VDKKKYQAAATIWEFKKLQEANERNSRLLKNYKQITDKFIYRGTRDEKMGRKKGENGLKV